MISCQADIIRDELVDEFLADEFTGGGMCHHCIDDVYRILDAVDPTLVRPSPILVLGSLEIDFCAHVVLAWDKPESPNPVRVTVLDAARKRLTLD